MSSLGTFADPRVRVDDDPLKYLQKLFRQQYLPDLLFQEAVRC